MVPLDVAALSQVGQFSSRAILMSKSLADQLLKAGLVDQNKLKQAQQEQRKKAKQAKQKKGTVQLDEVQVRLAQQRAEKAERDRQLNHQRLETERAKAIQAQVRQMLEQHGIKADGEVRFNFTDPQNNRIKQIYVDKKEHEQLAVGLLAICMLDDRYVLVPATIADKIAERQPEAVIFRAEDTTQAADDDDPYKDYPIPDDLMW